MGVHTSYWNQAYADGSYLKNWDYEYPSQELIGHLASSALPPASAVLDLGCGGGRDAIYLAQLGFKTCAIDLSDEAIKIAKERAMHANVNVDWRVDNVLSLPFADDSFDLITDRACFHHIPHEDRPQYASEVARTLKIGGTLLIRGSYQERTESFFAVTHETIHAHFGQHGFQIGRVYPIVLANNAGQLGGNMVVLKKISLG